MKDSSKTIAELSSQKSHLLLVFPFVREATARFLLLNTWYTYFFPWRSLTANAYNLNHLKLVSGEKYAKSMLR